MAPRNSVSLLDRSDDIRKWQVSACDGEEATASTAIISALYDALMSLLKVVSAHVKQLKPEPSYFSSLENDIAALFFWGRDFGVLQGELDVALRSSHRLRDIVLTLLVLMGDILSLGLIRTVSIPEGREVLLRTSKVVSLTEVAKQLLDEPRDAINYDDENIEGLCITLHNTIESLKVLSSSLESVADDEFDDEEARTGVYLKDRAAHEYFVDLVGSRFPSANQQLVEALGQSNWDRYNYVQRLRETALETPDVAGTDKAQSEFHDSGIGSSVPAQSVVADDPPLEYAGTVISSRAESSHKRLPPFPEVARSGDPFKCEICNRTVQFRRTREWKKHIFEDICAYTCIFIECSSIRVLFKDREAMTNHLMLHHGITENITSEMCPLCLEQINGGLNLVSIHFARHMEEIALGVLPQGAESEDGSEGSDKGSEQLQEERLEVTSESTKKISGQEILKTAGTELPYPDKKEHGTGKENLSMKCICGRSTHDGDLIRCRRCGSWQHIVCFYQAPEEIPAVHGCHECAPNGHVFRCPVIGCQEAYKNRDTLVDHMKYSHKGQQLKEDADGTFPIIVSAVEASNSVNSDVHQRVAAQDKTYTKSNENRLPNAAAFEEDDEDELHIRADVKRLRRESELKEARLRELEARVMALQQQSKMNTFNTETNVAGLPPEKTASPMEVVNWAYNQFPGHLLTDHPAPETSEQPLRNPDMPPSGLALFDPATDPVDYSAFINSDAGFWTAKSGGLDHVEAIAKAVEAGSITEMTKKAAKNLARSVKSAQLIDALTEEVKALRDEITAANQAAKEPIVRFKGPRATELFKKVNFEKDEYSTTNHLNKDWEPSAYEPPFKCDQCPLSFRRNHDLKRHKRIHLAVKPFSCKFCSRSFSRKSALDGHMKSSNCGKHEVLIID